MVTSGLGSVAFVVIALCSGTTGYALALPPRLPDNRGMANILRRDLRRLATHCECSMDLDRMAPTPDPHFDRPGGCFTCHYAGAPIDPTGHDRRLRCSKPGYWPANLPETGCCGWEREPGSDDE
jgi:hypothetical protein